MNRIFGILVVVFSVVGVAGAWAQSDGDNENTGREYYTVDTPFYTLRGPEYSMVAIIQTEMEVEYIGDYLDLDMKRAKSALRLLGHVDFVENVLLVVNGGLVEDAMLRVESVYEENGELHVVIVTAEPPEQYRGSDFASPASTIYTPSLVTVLPRFQGRLIVHTFPTEWAAGGDLRGVQLVVAQLPAEVDESTDAESPGAADTD